MELAMKLLTVLTLVTFAGAMLGIASNDARAVSEAACASPVEVKGFKTCADVSKAEQEGAIVLYTTDNEQGTANLLRAFNQLFPKIKTDFVRLQAGALYAKLIAERQARSYGVDLIQLSDMSFALDLQKKGGYRSYISPSSSAYKPGYKSQPEGYWTWGAVMILGLAYNPNVVPPDQAPKTWQDALDPKWKDAINVKVSNSGAQHLIWYELQRLYGPEYFKKFGELNPRGYDAYVQQYQRVVNGEDKIVHSAAYSGYLEFKAKGAPIEYVYPPDGLPAGPYTWGTLDNSPHPRAAELFLDWFLSPLGQKAYADNLFLHSLRSDVAPPPGGVPITQLKLLLPADWNAFFATRPQYQKDWDRMTGLRR
jgi:iron(III) transport system substrate-binding protein